jgi:hypothetical protein
MGLDCLTLKRMSLFAHPAAHLVPNVIAGNTTCKTCRVLGQLCSAGAIKPCNEEFWMEKLRSVFNCRELPFSHVNAQRTYQFFCTSSAVEFAFYHGKRWGWVTDPAFPMPADEWYTAGEHHCAKFPDEYRPRMYAFILLVKYMDDWFADADIDEDLFPSADTFKGEWRTRPTWHVHEQVNQNYRYMQAWDNELFRIVFHHANGTDNTQIVMGDRAVFAGNNGVIPAPHDDDIQIDNDVEAGQPAYSELELSVVYGVEGERRNRVAVRSIDGNGINTDPQNGRPRFYHNFLAAVKTFFEKPEVLDIVRNTVSLQFDADEI